MTPKECIISEVENIKGTSEQWKGNEAQDVELRSILFI